MKTLVFKIINTLTFKIAVALALLMYACSMQLEANTDSCWAKGSTKRCFDEGSPAGCFDDIKPEDYPGYDSPNITLKLDADDAYTKDLRICQHKRNGYELTHGGNIKWKTPKVSLAELGFSSIEELAHSHRLSLEERAAYAIDYLLYEDRSYIRSVIKTFPPELVTEMRIQIQAKGF